MIKKKLSLVSPVIAAFNPRSVKTAPGISHELLGLLYKDV
jgi:hypothetical protein